MPNVDVTTEDHELNERNRPRGFVAGKISGRPVQWNIYYGN